MRIAAVVVSACIALIPFTTVRADDSAKIAEAKKRAEALAEATVKGEYEKVIDGTYPKVVEILGGRDKAIATTKNTFDAIKGMGISIKEFVCEKPGEIFTEGSYSFIVVPTRVTLEFKEGLIKTKSYQLGISGDQGKTWAFVDGTGLSNPASRERMLPKLPEKLKLPEPSKPEVIKN